MRCIPPARSTRRVRRGLGDLPGTLQACETLAAWARDHGEIGWEASAALHIRDRAREVELPVHRMPWGVARRRGSSTR